MARYHLLVSGYLFERVQVGNVSLTSTLNRQVNPFIDHFDGFDRGLSNKGL